MNKLTAEKCREMFLNLFEDKRQEGITMKEDLYMQALEIALPILEQQERVGEKAKCPLPCGWKELLRLTMEDGAFLAKNLTDGVEVNDDHRHAAFRNTDRLVKVITAMLYTKQEPGESEWIEWGGGECPVGSDIVVEYKTRIGNIHSNMAYDLRWIHEGKGGDIIAYRLTHSRQQPVKPKRGGGF